MLRFLTLKKSVFGLGENCLNLKSINIENFRRARGEVVNIINKTERVVPLEFTLFDGRKIVNICETKSNVNEMVYKRALNDFVSYVRDSEYDNERDLKRQLLMNVLQTLLDEEKFPVIVFYFTKRDVEFNAERLYQSNFDFTTEDEKKQIKHFIEDRFFANPEFANYISLKESVLIQKITSKGVGYHHGSMMPVLKKVVEDLFNQGLIKCLIATNTLAIGMNMPAKTVVFCDLVKRDSSLVKKVLCSSEFLQMAGRAGRRGKEPIGNVVLIPPFDSLKHDAIKNLIMVKMLLFKKLYNNYIHFRARLNLFYQIISLIMIPC